MKATTLFCCIAIAPLLLAQDTNLPSSKRLGPAPGRIQKINSLPTASAVSPDGSKIVFVHTGYGSGANGGMQSITLVDTATGTATEYNESLLKLRAKQTFSFGIAFSRDGQHLYVPFGSTSDPLGQRSGDTGNAIGVYSVGASALKLERSIPLGLADLPSGKSAQSVGKGVPSGKQVTFPAGIAVFQQAGREKLVVAEQLADSVSIVDIASGKVENRLYLGGQHHSVPSVYPYNVVITPDDRRAFVSLWNDSAVVEIDLGSREQKRIALQIGDSTTSTHPAALLMSPPGDALFVSLANRDRIARIDLRNNRVQYERTTPLDQQYPGAYPDALALTADGKTLFVANASQDSVAVMDVSGAAMHYRGAFSTEWYPTVLAATKGRLFVGTAKGTGFGPNKGTESDGKPRLYGPKLVRGSVAQLSIADILPKLPVTTREVVSRNAYRAAQTRFQFAGANPIKHVIYIIKENRTYDQVFGDIKEANGDPSITMYGEDITPNQHALARQFGILDNFYDSGEVSGSGHVWSTAAITSDYTERIWPINYRGGERTYDFEGNVSNSIPLLLGIDDVNEPGTGYLWTNLARHHRTYRHYGEFVETKWCGGGPKEAPEAESDKNRYSCPVNAIERGGKLPNGSNSPYPWKIPLIHSNVATKRELENHFDPNYADFNLDYPDQLRADEFIKEFRQFERDGTFPEFIVMRLPNDHTSGGFPNKPSPRAAVADNDLALGRVVEAVSHSKYWNDTAIFVLEDDAQDGADHVDAHRSIGLVISKYSPRRPDGEPFVESGFFTTVNMVHTMEALLGLPPMNANDAYAPVMYRMFSGKGEQAPFTADRRNEKSGLLYEQNAAKGGAARASAKLDFSHADAADSAALNRVLWRLAKGNQAMPKPVHNVLPATLHMGRDDD